MKPYAYALTSSPEKTAEYFAWSPNSASFLKRSLRKKHISFRLSKKIGWKKGRKQARLIFEQMCFTSLRSPPAWVYACGLRKLLLSTAMWGDAATSDLEQAARWDQHLWFCVKQKILGGRHKPGNFQKFRFCFRSKMHSIVRINHVCHLRSTPKLVWNFVWRMEHVFLHHIKFYAVSWTLQSSTLFSRGWELKSFF